MRHKVHPNRQTKTLVTIFMGTIVLAMFLNFGLMNTWMDALARKTISVNGVERSYQIRLPGLQQEGPYPIVVFLQDPSEMKKATRARFGFSDAADRDHFGIVYPEPDKGGWQMDDADFITSLVKELSSHKIASPDRVYLAGETGGGRLAFSLACRYPELFAATAVITATMTEQMRKDCTPQFPMPMLIINGTNDMTVNWQGAPNADPAQAYLSAHDTAGFWKAKDGCDTAPVRKTFEHRQGDDPTVVRREIWPHCKGGTRLAVYTVNGGGHQAPSISGDNLLNEILGPQNHDIETTEEIWTFFEGFTR